MTAAALRPGDPSRLGSYELTGRLGAGGQGVVYLGRGPAGEFVAIKVLHGEVDESFLFRELSMARKVASFCTAQVLEAGVWGDVPYVVSEYVDGRSLSDVIEADGPRTGGALDRLAIGTVTALAAIHQAGVVHRDFKPANVLLGPDGPRVIDFGIARAVSMTVTAGEIRGTPVYMAPEQISGQPAGTAADMFAWAVTMVYAATGPSPFGSDTLPAVIQRVLYAEPDVSALTAGCASWSPPACPRTRRPARPRTRSSSTCSGTRWRLPPTPCGRARGFLPLTPTRLLARRAAHRPGPGRLPPAQPGRPHDARVYGPGWPWRQARSCCWEPEPPVRSSPPGTPPRPRARPLQLRARPRRLRVPPRRRSPRPEVRPRSSPLS